MTETIPYHCPFHVVMKGPGEGRLYKCLLFDNMLDAPCEGGDFTKCPYTNNRRVQFFIQTALASMEVADAYRDRLQAILAI